MLGLLCYRLNLFSLTCLEIKLPPSSHNSIVIMIRNGNSKKEWLKK